MSIGTSVFFNESMDWLFSVGRNLAGGDVKLALLAATYTPDAEAHAEWADISSHQIVHASYPSGGQALASPAVIRTAASPAARLDSDDWTLSFTGADTAAKYAVIYVDATVGAYTKPLLAWLDLNEGGGAVTIPGGYTFTLPTPATGWVNWGAS